MNTIIARGVVFDIPPMALSFYRWLLALIFILPFALPSLKKDWPLIRINLPFLIFLSIPSVAVYNSVLYLGAQFTTATNISLVIATMPVMTILFSWLMNREKPSFPQIVGIVSAVTGVLMIISKGALDVLLSLSVNPGDLLTVISISSWSFYSVMLKRREIAISPISFLAAIIFFGVLCILPFYLLELYFLGGFEVGSRTVLIFLYLGIFPSILAYLCWNFGVRTAGASIASVFMYLLPVFTSVLAFLFLKEKLSFYHITGGLFIFSGLLMSAFKQVKKSPQKGG